MNMTGKVSHVYYGSMIAFLRIEYIQCVSVIMQHEISVDSYKDHEDEQMDF